MNTEINKKIWVDKIIDNFYLKDRRFGGISNEKKTNS